MTDLFGTPTGRADDSETLKALEVDYTPPAVAVQLLLALGSEVNFMAYTGQLDMLGWNVSAPLRVLDPAAGSGCWGRALRAVLGEMDTLTGIEPRESERSNVLDTYDAVFMMELQAAMKAAKEVGSTGPFDLVATNPPFSAFEEGWPIVLLNAGWLAENAIVAFYGLTQWGQSESAAATLRAWSPFLQLRLGGRVAHRGGGQADAREYSLWAWSVADRRRRGGVGQVLAVGRRFAAPSWRTVQLPALPSAMRRWSPAEVPGTCPIAPALVDRVRGYL